MTAETVKKELAKYANTERAIASQRFFKTGSGEYGEGDQFIGVSMPNTRAVCKNFVDLPFNEVQKLLNSPIHEHRMAGVIILSKQYAKAGEADQQKIFELYLENVYGGWINNWDLIDVTTGRIVGKHLLNRPRKLLFDLAKSEDVWQKRVAIISSFEFINNGDASTSLKLAKILMYDKHDLIQKAVGWMLREVGKRVNRQLLLDFLDQHAERMPRTMLRYSIEHLTPQSRAHYLALGKAG